MFFLLFVVLLSELANCFLSGYEDAVHTQTHTHTDTQGRLVLKWSQDQVLIRVLKMLFSRDKTKGPYCSRSVQAAVCVHWAQKKRRRGKKKGMKWSVHSSVRGGKNYNSHQSFLPPRNAGIVLKTAGFQSTLKCNWTLERQPEMGRHCQGQSTSLARHRSKQPD